MHIILQRNPREQHAPAPHLVMDMFDVPQCQQSNQRAYVSMKLGRAALWRNDTLSDNEQGTTADLLQQNL